MIVHHYHDWVYHAIYHNDCPVQTKNRHFLSQAWKSEDFAIRDTQNAGEPHPPWRWRSGSLLQDWSGEWPPFRKMLRNIVTKDYCTCGCSNHFRTTKCLSLCCWHVEVWHYSDSAGLQRCRCDSWQKVLWIPGLPKITESLKASQVDKEAVSVVPSRLKGSGICHGQSDHSPGLRGGLLRDVQRSFWPTGIVIPGSSLFQSSPMFTHPYYPLVI